MNTTKALFSELVYDFQSERWNEFELPKLSSRELQTLGLLGCPSYGAKKAMARMNIGESYTVANHVPDSKPGTQSGLGCYPAARQASIFRSRFVGQSSTAAVVAGI
jgi:hypothetical protein